MQFVSDSELIFTVMVSGMPKRVCFGERSGNGVSSYITNNEAIARAIRKTQYYKQGRITEDQSKVDDMYYHNSVEEAHKSTPVKTRVTKGAAAKGNSLQDRPSGTEVETSGTMTKTAGTVASGVQKFTSITFAKNYLAKEFGIDKKALKTPEQVIAAAEAHGVKIEF